MARDLYRNVLRGIGDSPQLPLCSLAALKDMSPMSSLAHTLHGASLTHTPCKRLSLSSSVSSDSPKSFQEISSSGLSDNTSSDFAGLSDNTSSDLCVSCNSVDKSLRAYPEDKENLIVSYYSPSHGYVDRRVTKSPLKEIQNVNRNLSFSPLKKPISPSRREHLSPVKKVLLVSEECDSNSRDSGYSESGHKRCGSSDESDQKKDKGFSIPLSCAPTRKLNLDMSPQPTGSGRKLRSFASLTASCDEDAFLMDLIGDVEGVPDPGQPSGGVTTTLTSLFSAPIHHQPRSPPSPLPSVTSALQSHILQRLPIRRCLSMANSNMNAEFLASSTPLSSRVKVSEEMMLVSPSDRSSPQETCHGVFSFKRPQPPVDSPCPIEAKRRKSEVPEKENEMDHSSVTPPLTYRRLSSPENTIRGPDPVGAAARMQRSHSESHVEIMRALNNLAYCNGELTGDFSRPLSLPVVALSKHPDLKSISAHTLADLVKGCYSDTIASFQVVDCRYPYEYEGGHVVDASNWHHPSMIQEHLDAREVPPKIPGKRDRRQILIFHCEFSAERGPRAQRLLREYDRTVNKEFYPALHYPEMYLLEGGYKAFYEAYPQFCVPNSYVKMLDEKHSEDLKFFRSRSKSWASENKINKARWCVSRTGPKRLGL